MQKDTQSFWWDKPLGLGLILLAVTYGAGALMVLIASFFDINSQFGIVSSLVAGFFVGSMYAEKRGRIMSKELRRKSIVSNLLLQTPLLVFAFMSLKAELFPEVSLKIALILMSVGSAIAFLIHALALYYFIGFSGRQILKAKENNPTKQ